MNNNDKQKLEQLKRAAALHLLQKRNGTSKETRNLAQIPHADRSLALPLFWAQQRLWFLDQIDHAAGAAYHIPAALRLSGFLHRDALKTTLNRIVARHESLRTTFVRTNGDPVQVIGAADDGFMLAEHDLRNLSDANRQHAVTQLTVAEAEAPFDLAQGPLIRGRLLRLAEDEHILLVTQHHIVSDGWSMGVLVREVSALYKAFSQGQADPLPPLAIQYPDYAVWQRQSRQGKALQEQINFWQSHLEDAPALLELPTDHPRPTVQRYRGGNVSVALSGELSADLRALSNRHGATLFMTLLVGWSIVLSRLSRQLDIVVGTGVANRQHPEVEALIGFFINTLALRVKLNDDPTVANLLAQVKTTALAAYEHQDVPFEQVVKAVQPERSLSHHQLFQVMFVLDNTSGERRLELPGLTLEPLDIERHTTQFDLALSLNESASAIVGNLQFASDLFDAESATRIAGYLQHVLAGMVADDQQRVSELSLLSPTQRRQLMVEFNGRAANYTAEQTIERLFEAQAARCPDQIALEFEDTALSYAELNIRANRLARHLRNMGFVLGVL